MLRRWKWLAAAGVTIFAGGMAAGMFVSLRHGVSTAVPIFGSLVILFTLTATVLGWRAATHPRLDARTRDAWRWISTSLGLLTVSIVLFNVMQTAAVWVVCIKLTGTLLLLIGLARLPMRPLSREHRLRLFLDAGTVAAAAGLYLWYLLIAPVIAAGRADLDRVASAVAMPLLDVGLIFVMTVVLMRGVNSSVRHTTRLLIVATLCWMVGETTLPIRDLDASHQGQFGWEFVSFPIAHFLLCVATFEQVRVASADHDLTSRARQVSPVSKLPYVAVAAVFVVLTIAAAREQFRLPWLGLIFCTAVLTGCVVARQVLAQQENMRMAVTDGLTGLTNRIGLNEALQQALNRGKTTAVLLADLDGFKSVNDTLGHEAGDQMLIAFARALRKSVLGSDVVARLGGDEFAVVLADVKTRENADAVVHRLSAELEKLEIRCSVGVAIAGPGEMTVDQILHRADMEMYDVKRSRKALIH